MRFDDLKTAIITQYDLPTPAASGTWVTTAQLSALTNRALRRYSALLLDCGVDHYYGTSSTITASAGVIDTALPTRFVRLVSLAWARGTDDLLELEPARPEDEYLVGYSAQDWTTWTPRFKVLGTNFRWLPKPLGTYSVTCTYEMQPSDLSAEADTFDAGTGWDNFIIGDVCAMLAAREERPTGDWVAMREEARQLIMEQAPLRGATKHGLFVDAAAVELSDWDVRNRVTLGNY